MPGYSKRGCYYFTTEGMTVALQSVKVVPASGAMAVKGHPVYTVLVTFRPGELGPLNALISRVMGQPAPRDELAWIMDGRVVISPVVAGRVVATFSLTAPGGLAAQQRLARELEGQLKPVAVYSTPAHRT